MGYYEIFVIILYKMFCSYETRCRCFRWKESMDMKKICYCTTIPLTINSFILKSAEYIHENTDWDISIICSYEEDFANSLPDYIHYFPINMKRGLSFDGIKVIHKMKKIFRHEKFDLVQYSTPNASLYASIAAKLAKIPVRLYCQWGMVYVGFTGIKRKIFKLEEKFVCKLSTWVEPDSKSNLNFAHSEKLYPKDKGSVIWNGSACGINLDKFDITRKNEYRTAIREKYNIPDDAFVFVFVGRVNRDKGINELLEAYKKLVSKNTAYLLVVGNSEMDSTVNKDLYDWSVNEKRVIYVGSTNVVEQYLGASDCYILPSYREGFGLSVIEAEAMGLPVIVTDIPGPIDAILPNKTGIAVEKQNSDELLKAMELLYNDSQLRESFGIEGHRFVVQNFEQKKLLTHILEDRKNLLKNS